MHNIQENIMYVLFKTFSKLGIQYGTLNNLRISILSRTWKYLFKEIFIKEVYDFEAKTNTPVILDCGANIGFSSLFFINKYPQAQITAFEAAKETYEKCQQTFSVNKIENIKLVNKALSDADNEQVTFYQNSTDGCDLGAALFSTKQSKTETVETTKLSNYINGSIDYLKLDIEGAETMVFKDLTASKKLSLINEGLIEFHLNSAYKNNDLGFILSKLTEFNFEYRFLACDKLENWNSQAILIRFKKIATLH